jgi:hypothetical protein
LISDCFCVTTSVGNPPSSSGSNSLRLLWRDAILAIGKLRPAETLAQWPLVGSVLLWQSNIFKTDYLKDTDELKWAAKN